jgi:major membrane immunogen (membrane-anchored lipoprotein)
MLSKPSPQMQIGITRFMLYSKHSATCGWLMRPSQAMLALLALLALTSCGADDGLGKRYPVSGTVTYNGNPLEKGEISFVSEDLKSNIGATGTITNGSYSLSTGGNDDGAQAGKYKVTITAKEDFLAKAKADFQKETKQQESNYIPPQFVAKAEAAAKSLIPAGYGDSRTTTLQAVVKTESNKLNFELSDKDAPPEPPKTPTKGRGRR